MKKRQVIYTITSLHIKKVRNEKKKVIGQIMEHGHCRTVGFYTNLKTAKQCVEEDWASFDEAGYYNYIVIEKMVEGLYNIQGLDDPVDVWYYHDYDNRKWISCKKPKSLFGTIGFGLG